MTPEKIRKIVELLADICDLLLELADSIENEDKKPGKETYEI